MRKNESHESADAFYSENREAMDSGAALDWLERYTRGKEASALQHAENLLCDLGGDVFSAEYQNAPEEEKPSVYKLTAQLVASRVHPGRNRCDVPVVFEPTPEAAARRVEVWAWYAAREHVQTVNGMVRGAQAEP